MATDKIGFEIDEIGFASCNNLYVTNEIGFAIDNNHFVTGENGFATDEV